MFFRIFCFTGLAFGLFQVVMGLLRGYTPGLAIISGVVSGVFFGLGMAVVLNESHRWGTKRRGFDPDDPDFSVDARKGVALPISPDEALERCRTVLEADMRFSKVRTDPAEWTVQARARWSWSSLGEKIECRVYSRDDGSQVEIRSRPVVPSTIADYGKNRENVERIRALLLGHAPARAVAAG
ncbi:MAG TPA: DUF1499 domain-containing protein [Longimicrobium sp.]|nr:DUF1499 domain-containing protein [Longimicrobium sp.]